MFFIITDCNTDQCATSSSLYRQRQKIYFCRCHRQTFHYNLSKIPKQFDCCEMFICCCEMLNKNRSIPPSESLHRPHLIYQRLLFLPANHPDRQNRLHAKQHKEEQPHLQERELIWDNCTGKGFFTYFRTDCHGKRQPQDQDCKRRKKRIAHPLNDIHPA